MRECVKPGFCRHYYRRNWYGLVSARPLVLPTCGGGNGLGDPNMAARHFAGIMVSLGLALCWSSARAADPQPQYTVQDVAKAFADKPAAAPGDTDEAAPPAGACEAKGKVTGPDGLCYKANNATAGFNLGKKTTRPEPVATPVVHRARPAPAQQVASASGQKDLQITFKVG